MVKAADALADAGYDVRVVSTNSMPDRADADARLHRTRSWAWDVVSYSREAAPMAWARTGVRRKVATTFGTLTGSTAAVAARIVGRAHDELVRQILKEPADLIYAGTVGALAAAAEAGRRRRSTFALDLEDFHPGEHVADGEGALLNDAARAVVTDASSGAAFVTTASSAMSAAFAEHLGLQTTPIHNVFPLPAAAPPPIQQLNGPLRLYWFSQSLGLKRGLQDVIRAAGLLDRPVELHVRAATDPETLAVLEAEAAATAPRLRIIHHELSDPDTMVDACRPYDIGLSVEQGHIPNAAVTLPNKATTYILAGLPVALTDIPGQRQLAADLGEGAIVFSPGDAEALAHGIERLVGRPETLADARAASWKAASSRWHWEHRCERGQLLELVRQAVA